MYARLKAFFDRFISIAMFTDESEEKNADKIISYSQPDDAQLLVAADNEEVTYLPKGQY